MKVTCAHCREHELEPQCPMLYRDGLEYVKCPCGGWTARLKDEDITTEAMRRYLDMMVRMEIADQNMYGKQGVY